MSSAAVTSPPSSSSDDDPLVVLMAKAPRPSRPSPLAASLTFGWRALLKIKHVPIQLFDVTIFPVMITLMFTYLFGGALAGSTSVYLRQLLPGILVMSILMITMYTGSALNNDLKNGIFDRFRSMSLWRPSVVLGAMLADIARYSIAGLLVLVLGLIMGFRPEGGVLGVAAGLAIVLVFAYGLGWIWTTFAFIMPTPHATMAIGALIVFPLSFVSNIFVDPATMPSWLEWFVGLNPVTHLVTATRGLMAGTVYWNELGWVLAATVVLTVVFAPLTMRLYNRSS